MRFLVATAMLFYVGCALFFMGCGPGQATAGSGPRATVNLTWRFADGRRCAEAGVLQVQLTPKLAGTLSCNPATCLMLCSDGEGGPGVMLTLPEAGCEIDMAALSPQSDTLYRGTLVFDGQVPAAATAVLYFTAGK